MYTAGRMDVYALAGSARASCRKHVLEALTGQKQTQAKAGVTALRAAIYAAGNITGDCEAHRETKFIHWGEGQLF